MVKIVMCSHLGVQIENRPSRISSFKINVDYFPSMTCVVTPAINKEITEDIVEIVIYTLIGVV